MYNKLIADIEDYIANELYDSLYYQALADKAGSGYAKEILMEFSNDEKCHGEELKQAYYHLTGKAYTPPQITKPDVPGFEEALILRMAAETKDYRKYGEQYLEAPNKYLKHLFFMIKTGEAIHAMRIPILLQEIKN